MLSQYIQAAMHHATYKILDDENTFFGEIPGLQGVYANSETLETCRDELQEVLEEWILLGLFLRKNIPIIDNIDLNLQMQPEVA